MRPLPAPIVMHIEADRRLCRVRQASWRGHASILASHSCFWTHVADALPNGAAAASCLHRECATSILLSDSIDVIEDSTNDRLVAAAFLSLNPAVCG